MRTMEITTRIGCKNMCRFCPQLLLIKTYNKNKSGIIMSFETFKTCIDKIPNDVRIDFSGMAEPWLNTDATKMLLYAYASGHTKIAVYTTCVGMSVEDLGKIKDIPYKTFVVHLADAEGNAKISVTAEYLKVLRELRKINIHNMSFMTMGKLHPKLVPLFGKLAKSSPMISRAGNLMEMQKTIRHGPIMCVSPAGIKHNILLPNGDMILCCMDYGLQHTLGNLLTGDYRSLFNGKEFKSIQQKMKNEKYGDVLCRNCEFAARDDYKKYLHPIQIYSEAIIRRLSIYYKEIFS